MKLTPHGIPQMVVGTIVLIVIGSLLGWIWWPLSFLVLPVFIWLIAFFRDPHRVVPSDPRAVVSPADGTVSDVVELESAPHLNRPAVRVGIFLSIFNVHINRAPMHAKVLDVIYKKGTFKNAMDHSGASNDNESNTIVLGDVVTGEPIATVKQIAGLIARRIVCTVKPGDVVNAGDRIGLIKFGSRTEIALIKSMAPEVKMTVGQKVKGASDVVALLGAPSNAIA
jgi:phosphatidylserine decarboxylase